MEAFLLRLNVSWMIMVSCNAHVMLNTLLGHGLCCQNSYLAQACMWPTGINFLVCCVKFRLVTALLWLCWALRQICLGMTILFYHWLVPLFERFVLIPGLYHNIALWLYDSRVALFVWIRCLTHVWKSKSFFF